jgi:cold shock protein
LPLQFRQASPSVEIWTGNQDARAAGWVDQSDIDVKRNLLIKPVFYGIEGCPIRAVRLGLVGQCGCPGKASGSLATFDDGSAGKVLWFSEQKGFGFIQPINGEKDVFVHYTGIESEGYRGLEANQIVEFVVVDGPKGPLAQAVVVLG